MPTRRLRLTIIGATGMLLAGLSLGTELLVGRMRHTAEENARQTVQRVARVVESTVNRQFLAVDGMLAGLPAILAQVHGGVTLDQDSATRVLRELNFQNFNFRDLVLVRPDGRPWASALPASRSRELPVEAERLTEAQRIGAALISGPARNPLTGEWALFFLRAIALPEVGPLVAIAEVPLTLVSTLLSPVGEVPGLAIGIERADGMVLLRLPHDEQLLGRKPAEGAAPPARDGGAITLRTQPHGQESFLATRPTLYQDVHISVSYELDDAFATWTLDRRRVLGVATGTGALLILLALALTLALRQREKVEAERAQARVVLESAIETMPDGFVMYDANDRLVICNQRFRDLYAISAPFIVPGARFEDIIREGARRGQYPYVKDDIEGFVIEMAAWRRGNRPSMERLLPDGRWVMVTERSTPDGGTVGIRTEITALKQAMAELAQARDQAAAATEAKSRFLARMSHELRTPLNGVLGLAQALARDPVLTGEQRARARTLEAAGRHLVAVANDVLDLARIEAGRLELRLAPATLGQVLEGCAALIRPAAEEKSVLLRVEIGPGLPTRFETDRTRLQQAILNLLSNAVKFSPAGGTVELEARPAGPPGADGRVPVRIEVRDRGPGVPEAERGVVFGDFVQLEPGSRMGGTGLGLAIAAGIVAQMEGRIGCCDNPAGSGALFWFEVPLRPLAEAEADAGPKEAEPAPPRRRSLAILVADDVPANLAVARALLESAGHRVHCVADGAQALEAVQAGQDGRRFDAVLMDVMMPVMDGLEATRRIRELPGPLGRVPILAITASAFAEDVAACLAAGMDAHQAKPIERDSLLATLDRLTGGEAPQEAVAPSAAAVDFRQLPLLTQRGGAALSLPGLDARTALRLAPEFISEIRLAAAALGAAAPDAPAEQAVIPAAHRLVGAASTLGATRLATGARQLQEHAAQLPPPERLALREAVLAVAADSLAALDEAMTRLRAECANAKTA
ncbi:PAS-domain containing protein [Siccirubricoccus sp. KC 17139]|uniref:histidine kinase n=1 Tax=Siccirubricoccus soli TaxID=2899147 RepID=A0ABT1D4L9_9PROT|nr:PAS-domain containing protein [Siccirubricoccus soli]MCO6416863.1 PAS-domain containing protein [Siccirubricoccus soli]MCP2682998.1 PAS-domain containing protein [Siccirubricoccus soli]